MFIVLEIFVFIGCLVMIVVNDWADQKELAFDETKYAFWKDYWPVRNDNIIKRVGWSLLVGIGGFFSTGETLSYFFPAIDTIPVADGAIDIVSIIVFTLGAVPILQKFGLLKNG